jgi:general secretion pathway protein C
MLLRSIVPYAIAALGLSAWLQARGISALLGEQLGVPVAASRAVVEPRAVVDPPRSADAILARNPFDSTIGSLLLDPASASSPSSALSACADVHVLAIAADDDASRSLVLLRLDTEREPQLRGIGGDVVAIDPGVVLLDRSGVRCAARIFSFTPPPVSPTPPAAPHGIASLGAGSYAVDRAARDALIDGAADWMKSVSARPEKVGDEVVGIRVVALRPGSPLDGLGIRAGDVLQSVNGFALTTPDKLLEALARLRTADHLSLALARGGHATEVDYEVR